MPFIISYISVFKQLMSIGELALCYNNIQVLRKEIKIRAGKNTVWWKFLLPSCTQKYSHFPYINSYLCIKYLVYHLVVYSINLFCNLHFDNRIFMIWFFFIQRLRQEYYWPKQWQMSTVLFTIFLVSWNPR